MKKKKLPILFITVLSTLGLAGCAITSEPSNPEQDPIEVVHVSSIALSNKTLSLEVGATKSLIATILPENASNKNYSWSSSNPSIVSVEQGRLSALEVGEVTITVTTEDMGLTDTCVVTVTKSDDPVVDPIMENKYLLNPYGDYFEYIDVTKDASGLKDEFDKLSKEKNILLMALWRQNIKLVYMNFSILKIK